MTNLDYFMSGKCILLQLFWQPAKTTDSNVRQMLGFTFIKIKDLSKTLAVRIKVYGKIPQNVG